MSAEDLNYLIGETDAMKWAEAFVKTVEEHPTIPSDVGTMVGWFANPMCASYDEGYRAGLTAGSDDGRLKRTDP